MVYSEMEPDKTTLTNILNEGIRDLQYRLDQHFCRVAAILDGQVDCRHLPPREPICPSQGREEKLRQTIEEAIEVLEQSRKSFKSKQLELLRKKLTQVLIDNQ